MTVRSLEQEETSARHQYLSMKLVDVNKESSEQHQATTTIHEAHSLADLILWRNH